MGGRRGDQQVGGHTTVEREAREAARGESAKTPLLVIGGVGTTIAIVVALLVVAMLLIWRFA